MWASKTVQIIIYGKERRFYHLADHLGNVRATVTGQGGMVSKDAYFPFGKRIEGLSVNTSDPQDRYKYNGKELDRENDLNWFVPPRREARYYDPELGRWSVVDPAEEFYSGYLYGPNSPIMGVDPDGRDWYDVDGRIEWHDGSDPYLLPGFFNLIASYFGGGEYATSLGENVLVGRGSYNEDINTAIYELYLNSNKVGPVAKLFGNTLPSNSFGYATIAEGLYPAQLTEYLGAPALLLNSGGPLPTVWKNPNPMSDYSDQFLANEIFFHIGRLSSSSLWYGGNHPISKACLTGSNGKPIDYINFMSFFGDNWNGLIYLTRSGQPIMKVMR